MRSEETSQSTRSSRFPRLPQTLYNCCFLKPCGGCEWQFLTTVLLCPPVARPSATPTDAIQVPDNPIIPFIEGDGTGRDIWKASVRVFDAAVEKAYKGKRRVAWYEVFAGEKAMAKFNTWLPDDTRGRHPRISRRHQRTADHARSAAAFARSMSRCGRFSISIAACVR